MNEVKAEDAQLRAAVEALPQQLAEALRPLISVSSLPVGQDLDRLSNVQHGENERKLVAMPSKAKQVRDWFEAHPADRKKTGEWLQANIRPHGEEISYRTWNRYKK